MATYRQGPYRVEEGYAMIDQDGEKAHQETFAETAGQASELLRRVVVLDRVDTEIEVWSPGPAVRVVDTNVDYKTLSRTTILPWRVWESHGDPYVF